jgi:hypothetical protein
MRRLDGAATSSDLYTRTQEHDTLTRSCFTGKTSDMLRRTAALQATVHDVQDFDLS